MDYSNEYPTNWPNGLPLDSNCVVSGLYSLIELVGVDDSGCIHTDCQNPEHHALFMVYVGVGTASASDWVFTDGEVFWDWKRIEESKTMKTMIVKAYAWPCSPNLCRPRSVREEIRDFVNSKEIV